MATTFYHNGNSFEIIEGTEEVILRRSGEKSGDVILPKYAMYNDKRYTVTKIIPQKVKIWKNRNAEDKRKKPDWYESPYTRDDASLFCRVNCYYDGEKSDLRPKLDITSILIPSTVTEIGDYAFANCCSLKSLTIPDSVTSIGTEAFVGCTSLKSLTIPDSVTSIGHSAFALARGLESLRLSSNVKELEYALFGWGYFKQETRQKVGADQRNPTSIKIEIPSIVEEIGANAFDIFQNAEIIIYNEPGEVMVATDAFAPTASVKYVGKKAKADKKESQKQKDGVKPKSKPELKAAVDIKKSATCGNYTINIASNNSVAVLKSNVACDSAKAALREIADQVGFAYENSWNTQQFGSKLVDFLKEKK